MFWRNSINKNLEKMEEKYKNFKFIPYKENLKSASNSLGAIVDASGEITKTAKSITTAQNDAVKLQKELQELTENLNKLNKIYVGMYDAMHK